MFIHRVNIQYLSPLNRKVRTFEKVERDKGLSEAIESAIDSLLSIYKEPVEVLSLYVSVETL